MSIKRVLSVLVIAALFSFFVGLDSGYAADRQDGPEAAPSATEAEKRIDDAGRKGSIYDGAEYLIAQGIYEGNAVSEKDFQDNSGINPATSKAYSDRTIGRETASMLRVGITEQGPDGKIHVEAGINHDVLDAINEEAEALIPRKEAGTDRSLGLRRFNLTDLDEPQLDELTAIVAKHNLKNNAAVNIVAFESDFAQNQGQVLLNIVEELRDNQIAVIINATGSELNLIPGLQAKVEAGEIRIEVVAPESVAAIQFGEMFSNQKYVGLKGDLDKLRDAIAKGEVKA
ncbi:MAG: hypothetical protein HQ566_05630 [Candidatus Omnitrophica bacterium]|nr:hypothetical protein [Candidatus Omnitrophota bacterium]